MTVQELIAELSKHNPAAQVQVSLQEPYDDDAETLTDDAAEVTVHEGRVVIASLGVDDIDQTTPAPAAGFDGDKRWGNSAIPGVGVNSPAMMEARAAPNPEPAKTPWNRCRECGRHISETGSKSLTNGLCLDCLGK